MQLLKQQRLGNFFRYKWIDALLHVSDLKSWKSKKPADLVTIGQKLKVKITKIDEKTNRVSASLKLLLKILMKILKKNIKLEKFMKVLLQKLWITDVLLKLKMELKA